MACECVIGLQEVSEGLDVRVVCHHACRHSWYPCCGPKAIYFCVSRCSYPVYWAWLYYLLRLVDCKGGAILGIILLRNTLRVLVLNSAKPSRPPCQALQDPSHFGELGRTDGFMTKLLASQASGLEQVAVDTAAACDALAQTAGRIEALAKKGQQLVQQERRLSLASCSKEFGAIPSVDACREELQYIGCGSAGAHLRGDRFD